MAAPAKARRRPGFLYAQPNGGYTGIDLGAGHESAVSLVRFFASPGGQILDRMLGGRLEGCADGPSSGCQTLATVAARPAFGWNELAIANPGPLPLAALRRPRRPKTAWHASAHGWVSG